MATRQDEFDPPDCLLTAVVQQIAIPELGAVANGFSGVWLQGDILANHSRFVIQNDKPSALVVNIEPECVQVPLTLGEKLMVHDRFEKEPVTLKVESNDGETIISLWPGDGELRVEKDGLDIFEMAEKGACG